MLISPFCTEKLVNKISCATKSCDSGGATTGDSNHAGAQTLPGLYNSSLFC